MGDILIALRRPELSLPHGRQGEIEILLVTQNPVVRSFGSPMPTDHGETNRKPGVIHKRRYLLIGLNLLRRLNGDTDMVAQTTRLAENLDVTSSTP